MLFDWSAECGSDDPVLVVPWQDADSGLHFVDLRDDPYAIDELNEAELHPALHATLRALNAARSPVFSAKCDTWKLDPEEVETLRLLLLAEEEQSHAGYASYLDLLCRDRAMFASVHQHQHLLGRLERRLESLDLPLAMTEAVIRPAVLDLSSPQEGFCVTLYVKALGPDADDAYTHWAEALGAVTAIVRARDLFPQT